MELFLTFLEMKSHTGEEMANQVFSTYVKFVS